MGAPVGEVLARAHARTGDRIAISGYLGRGEAADTALVPPSLSRLLSA